MSAMVMSRWLGRSNSEIREGSNLASARRPLSSAKIKRHPRERDRRFESGFLQRRVCLASAFHAYRRKDPAFARSVSLDVTRERDVLPTSRLALVDFLSQALMQSPLEDHSAQREK